MAAEGYPADKIAWPHVYHTQVVAEIYVCKGSNDLVHEHTCLSFGVCQVCCPYYGNELVGKGSGLDLSSFASRELMDAQDVVVKEFIKGIDKEVAKKLWYPVTSCRNSPSTPCRWWRKILIDR